jgi:anti-sigma regulatory factor (Ser/Thr protein kinase)
MDILTNAVEAIPPGSPAANRVTVQTSLDSSGRATVLISDTGVGIEPADLPHVFEPFFTSKPRPVSTGLGLATARGAILASRGDISIESDLGRGTRVKVTLETVAVAPVKTATLRASVRPRQFMLVVDREPRVCAALARLLENDRTTFAYATPDDALERIMLGRAPDLIVLAIRDDEPQGFSFRDSLERAMPDFASRVVEIALPEENVTSEGRPRLHSSTQLSTVSRSRVSA